MMVTFSKKSLKHYSGSNEEFHHGGAVNNPARSTVAAVSGGQQAAQQFPCLSEAALNVFVCFITEIN